MSQFARPAGWLRQLFTQSQTAQPNPTILSNDVSLVQPYDGSGWGLWDPGQWIANVTSATIAADNTAIMTCPVGNIRRILAVSAQVTAGVAPAVYLWVSAQAGEVGVGDVFAAIANRFVSLDCKIPILGPGHVLTGNHTGGDAATIVNYRCYFVQAPLGAVFYL